MPIIARFNGIVIRMYFREHGRPHFHASYGDAGAVFDISSLTIIEGDLPGRVRQRVMQWANRYQDELRRMWETQEYSKLPGLDETL